MILQTIAELRDDSDEYSYIILVVSEFLNDGYYEHTYKCHSDGEVADHIIRCLETGKGMKGYSLVIHAIDYIRHVECRAMNDLIWNNI